MTRAATVLLTVGAVLFIALLASQDLPAVIATWSAAGWGLPLVALFHLLPLLLDAAAMWVLFRAAAGGTLRGALLTRWAGESVNSLMPAGQIGGPLWMARRLAQRGMPLQQASAAITVSTTLQACGQIVFAVFGAVLLGTRAGHLSEHGAWLSSLLASGVLTLQLGGFYWLQRRGLFGKLMRAASRFSSSRDWSKRVRQAESIDVAVVSLYARAVPVAASFALSLLGWLVGTGEVFLILWWVGHPVSWLDCLLLESLGQAIRGASFAVPGALGVQEGGYLLLAPIAGLSPDTALALSLAKRTRELLLGLPGLLYVHGSERAGARAARAAGHSADRT